jgi:hypothetical protein
MAGVARNEQLSLFDLIGPLGDPPRPRRALRHIPAKPRVATLAEVPPPEDSPGGDFWSRWLARPVTAESRLADLVFQIKRDREALRTPPHVCDDFLRERIERYRLCAESLMASLPETVDDTIPF